MEPRREITSAEKTKRLIMHLPHGIGMSVFVIWNPFLGALFMLVCVYYQSIEDWRIDDRSYIDVRGYLAGIPLGVLMAPFLIPLLDRWMEYGKQVIFSLLA